MAAVALAVGLIVGAGEESGARPAAERFARAWTRQDFAAMHAELTAESRRRFGLGRFREAYLGSYAQATTITVRARRTAPPRMLAGREVVRLAVSTKTRAFGSLDGELELPFEGDRVAWREHLAFPGLKPGEQLVNRIEVPRPARILARDGTPVRIDGLSQAFAERLAGKPGGELRTSAGRRLAAGEPEPAEPLRTTIDPELQAAAEAALGGRFGGVAVLDARSGAVRALAGVAYSALQPPGSTFKIVTTVAALEGGVATPTTGFPTQESATVGGRAIKNSHDDACGGTLAGSFARSCNSVFAPLGVQIGAERLVATAKRFGFNAQPQLFNQAAGLIARPGVSSIPETFESELDLGVTALGQGRVLTTPLQMASVAQTIAAGGVRHPTPVAVEPALQADAKPKRVTSARVARQLRDMMVAAVASGTGRLAAIAGTQVAGKTGTAELGSKPRQGVIEAGTTDKKGQDEDELETDAWFAGFVPARRPKLAIAVLVIKANADGGEVAAPIARQILAAGLQE